MSNKIYKLYIHPHDKEYAKRLGGRWNPINLTWEFKYMMTSQKFMYSVLRLKKKERDEKLKCYIFDRLEEINKHFIKDVSNIIINYVIEL